jgi:alanine racemase
MSTDLKNRAWVEVAAPALRRNFERIREKAGPEAGILPVIKTDAYGLGFEEAVRCLEPLQPWGYGIGTVEEGRSLRALGVDRPALVLAPLLPGDVREAVSLSLRPSVSSLGELERVAEAANELEREVSVHVAVDTGMGRDGFSWMNVERWAPAVVPLARGRVRWEGVFTHFHSADDPESGSVAEQAERFDRVLGVLRPLQPDVKLEHLCNSAGVLRRPDLARDLVRPGIFLYGGRPGVDLSEPEPVVALRARISFVRSAEPGATLGYGATYRAARRERWATVGIGYGDGLPRDLENRGVALVGGARAPIIGRISMGMTVVDITDLSESEADVGSAVTFVGADGGEAITLEEIASLVGRSAYELLTGLSPRLPRVWV